MREHDLFLQRALLDGGHIDQRQLDECKRCAIDRGVDLATAIIDSTTLTARQVALVKAELCEVPFVELSDYEISYRNAGLIPRSVANRYCMFPLFDVDGVVTFGMDDPLNLEALDQVRQIVRSEIDTVLCERDAIQTLISRAYSLSSSGVTPGRDAEIDIDTGDGADQDQPIVAAVNQILADAIEQGASDIHINPDDREMHLRFRVDGVLQEQQGPPLSMHPGLVQRLKVIANLDLTQTRRPQDGKFRFKHHGPDIDVRMSTMPTVCGENVVLRLLGNRRSISDFKDLGMPVDMAEQTEELIRCPYGMLLVTGPTGSGKTTTLYTALNRLNDPHKNIMTIEDPVEIRLPYLRQIQIRADIGLTFAGALRAMLRQDPDVVLVGEIRDNETATIALQAALTGHLVLSTVHTNDAAGAIARLRDYDLPSFVINSAVLGILAQRLVRRVCTHCTMPDTPTNLIRHRFALRETGEGFVRGKGCARCSQTGYRGRVGIYELLRFTSHVAELVEHGKSTACIRERAEQEGMRLMWRDGLEKARLGVTTLHEVVKVAPWLARDQSGELTEKTESDDARAAA